MTRRAPVAGRIGLLLVGTFGAIALAGPAIARYDPTAVVGGSLEHPSVRHWLGTNQISQDLASQLLHGARSSFLMALLGGLGTVLLGAVVGVTAGWYGRVYDATLMGLADLVVAVPRLPLLLIIGTYAGRSLLGMAAMLALVSWPGPARLVRGKVRQLRSELDVRAARSFGASDVYIIRRHVLPGIALLLVAAFVAAAGRAVMFESGLALFGLGDPARISWGTIIRQAHASPGLYYSPAYLWWMVPPVASIVLVLLGFTLVGSALENRLNPRLARHTAGRH